MPNKFFNAAPLDVRTFASSILGDRSPITEDNLSSAQKSTLYQLIQAHQQDRLSHLEIQNQADPARFTSIVDRTGKQLNPEYQDLMTARSGSGYLDYNDYDSPIAKNLDQGLVQQLRMTLGRTRYNIDPKTGITVNDSYDFNNEGRSSQISEYSQMNPLQKVGTVIDRSANAVLDYLNTKDDPINDLGRVVGGQVAEATMGSDSRPVKIVLPHPSVGPTPPQQTNSFQSADPYSWQGF